MSAPHPAATEEPLLTSFYNVANVGFRLNNALARVQVFHSLAICEIRSFMASHYFPRTSLKLVLFLTVGLLQPLFALAQGIAEVRAAAIDVAGLKIAMFSSDPHARLFFGSQAAMIETMEAADEIIRQPEYQFLIFFAGDNLFDDLILREDFLQFTGGEMKAAIVRILKPQRACAMHEVTLPGNVNGLVATLQTDAMDDIGSSSCVVSGLNNAWAGRTSESSGEIGRSIVEFIDLLEN